MSSGGNHITGILPARWGSSRFPGKPLHPIAGKPLIQHVWERCRQCGKLDELVIATDDERILTAATSFGARAIMTSPDHPTGTDRLAEAIGLLPPTDIVVNIQGDEPLIDPALIDELAAAMSADPSLDMVTAANPLDPDDPSVADPNVVKVVTTLDNRALYFSRSPIPYRRNPVEGLRILRHKGIYGYRRRFLEDWLLWHPTPLEQSESLEQLRALENGAFIRIFLTTDTSPGVDTPEQALEVEQILSSTTPGSPLPAPRSQP